MIGMRGLIRLEVGGELIVDPIDDRLQRSGHGRIVVALRDANRLTASFAWDGNVTNLDARAFGSSLLTLVYGAQLLERGIVKRLLQLVELCGIDLAGVDIGLGLLFLIALLHVEGPIRFYDNAIVTMHRGGDDLLACAKQVALGESSGSERDEKCGNEEP